MRGRVLKYTDFADRIDYDALYEDLGWEPTFSSGSEDKGHCLMPQNHTHGDSTGKLAINREKGLYNCWVCGGGSLLSLAMEVKELTYQDATAYLYQFADKAQNETADEFYRRVERLMTTPDEEKKPLPFFNERVLTWVGPNEWFENRHISPEVAAFFKLGVHEEHRKYNARMGEEFVGPAAIFPHFWKGKLVGWQERWLTSNPPEWLGKYTNTTDFPRETTVWGYDFALKQKKPPIIVESVVTALMLISEGYPAIATFGAQVTPDQLRHLRVFQQGVMLAPDNDGAGIKWLSTLTKYLERFIPVLHVPKVDGHGSDLGDLHPDELSTHLKGVTHGIS